MKLCNLKARFSFKNSLNHNGELIFHIHKFACTIYKHTLESVHVTGIASSKELETCKTILENKFQQKVIKIRVDNTFFMKKNRKKLNLNKIYSTLSKSYKEHFYISYHPEIFCGIHLKARCCKFPSAIFFSTGTYIIIGGQNLNAIRKVEFIMEQLLLSDSNHERNFISET